jgi:cytochrome o ubiquinol oxidase subunit IV
MMAEPSPNGTFRPKALRFGAHVPKSTLRSDARLSNELHHSAEVPGSRQPSVHAQHETDQASYGLYIAGFVLSVALTLTAYTFVYMHVHSEHEMFTHPLLRGLTDTLAIAQFFAQIYFFLHLGRETKPRWKLLVLSFMVLVVMIIVFGSLWIMSNLNYRMTPQQMNQYMINQNGGI